MQINGFGNCENILIKNILDSSLLTCVVLLRPEFKPFVGTIQLSTYHHLLFIFYKCVALLRPEFSVI